MLGRSYLSPPGPNYSQSAPGKPNGKLIRIIDIIYKYIFYLNNKTAFWGEKLVNLNIDLVI
jgi:hypothetical protein